MTLPNRKYPRADFHDYSGGNYFVTLCTKNHAHYFGEIRDNTMHFSAIGQFLENNILNIQNHYSDVVIPLHVVMPNHVHLVVSIVGNRTTTSSNFGVLNKVARLAVATGRDPTFETHYNSRLSTVIGSIKAATTRYARSKNVNNFAWLPRFHDHIIRNNRDGNLIHNYIINNVVAWDSDCYNIHRDRESDNLIGYPYDTP